jgi:ATP-binding cassette ChvD family protein
MADRIVFQLENLRKSYGQVEVLKGITLAFLEGAKIGVIGPNGAGKSTLLRIIAGEDRQFDGTAKVVGGLSIGYLSQEPPLNEALDVGSNLREAVAPIQALLDQYNEIAASCESDEDMARMSALQEEIEHRDAWDLESHLEQAAEALRLPPLEADVRRLSGGERRRVALCKLLMQHPDILLLDEPTNHLDADTVEWLEHHLQQYAGTVILITHDRYFLDNVVGWMLEIERGRATPYKGNYSEYLDAKQKLLAERSGKDAQRERILKREREWLGQTPAARRKRAKWREERYKQLLDEKADLAADAVELRIPPGPRLGDKVLEVRGVSKSFGGRTLIEDLSFELPPGAILGIVGPNGMGKTTLLRMVLGQERPDAGSITIGSTVLMRYLDQSRAILDDSKSVYDNICEGNPQVRYGNAVIDGRAYVARFNFRGEDQQKLLGECSGGMRNRVLLARMLREPANLIIMDEPTNDLDLETLRVLEEAIMEYPGSAIVVSHDRYFLNRVATHILAFEGDAEVNFHQGDFESYQEWRAKDRAARGVRPESKAGKYRKLLRA